MKPSQAERPILTDRSARTEICRAWLYADDMIEKHLGKALSARAYWRSLLEIYLADTEDRTIFSSCFLTGETPSNIHRRSTRMIELGALTRQQDARDHRRLNLRLTPAIRKQIEQVLDTVIRLAPDFSALNERNSA